MNSRTFNVGVFLFTTEPMSSGKVAVACVQCPKVIMCAPGDEAASAREILGWMLKLNKEKMNNLLKTSLGMAANIEILEKTLKAKPGLVVTE